MKRVLITGHSGTFFLRELVKHQYQGKVRCIVRAHSDTNELDQSGLQIEKFVGDLDDPATLERAIQGANTIFHIYNIHHSPHLVKEAMRQDVERVILVHTTGIYSNFKEASQRYKEIEEEVGILLANGGSRTRVTILRPTMIYGDLCDSNMSKFIKMLDRLRVMPVIDGGRNLIQPVNARDLGKAFYTVLNSPEATDGNAYDLSGEKPISMVDAFKVINKYLGKRTRYLSVPLGLGVFFARLAKVISFGKIDYVERVQRMAENRSYSHENAARDFGYAPISFDEGIDIEVQQYLSNKAKRQAISR